MNEQFSLETYSPNTAHVFGLLFSRKYFILDTRYIIHFMASQISHIIYAKKLFDSVEAGRVKIGGKINKDEFILGCVFPDIRRVEENLKRKDTHLNFYPLTLDFEKLTSFEAGWKFHLFCDMRREDILNKHQFYLGKENDGFYEFAGKILEDLLVYDEYDNWEKIVGYFNHPPFLLVKILEIKPETFRLWYAMVARYLEKKPTEKSARAFLTKQPNLQKHIDEIMKKVNDLQENKKAVKLLGKIQEEIV
jgi:hypothetical protein